MLGIHVRKMGSIRAAIAVALLLALFTSVPFGPPPVQAVSADIVISQIYGGGGNTSATLKNDFIELFNRGASPVTMTNWSVQYTSAAGTTWQMTAINGTINAGQYFLIQEAAGTGGTTALPTPDGSGIIPMSATAGKVALVTTTIALSGACPTGGTIRDFVGFGSTACFEGSGATPAPSNTTAVLRAGSGATDTNDNATDFAAGPPNPRNCGCGTPTRIHAIQGAAHISPLKGAGVADVPGIVTAVRSSGSSKGFFLQDPSPDADDATSEGIFVFTNTAPTVAVGDSVTVSGTVSEFRPGGTSGLNNLTVTEIGGTLSISLLSSGNPLPAPIVIGAGGRVAPSPTIEDDATGDVETSGVFDPANDAIDFYESLEGMRVQINDAVAVGPTNAFGETPVLPDNGGGATNRTPRGGVSISDYTNANPRRVILDSTITTPPTLDVNDTLPGATVGAMEYDFGNFMVAVTNSPARTPGGLTKEVTDALSSADQISIATFNVQNLSPGDGAAKFTGLANVIVTNLRSPDVVALEEVQDNTGATDDGTVDATTTATTLINAITTAGGPTYQYRDIVPVNDQDGGQPGGNIRVAFLFRTDRGVAFVDRAGGTSTAAVPIVTDTGGTHLSFSPGRIQPGDVAFTTSRKPLAGEITFHGHRLFVIANHFDAKLGDTPLFGHIQPPTRSSETQRVQQATIVHDFVQSLLTADPNAKAVVLGDLNDFPFSPALATLKGTPPLLTDLISTLPANEQYTYDFEGNSQVLDHILVTSGLIQPSLQYDVVHVNSEFSSQVSDHDPQVVRLTLPVLPPDLALGKNHTGNFTVGTNGTYTLTATNNGTGPTTGAITVTDTLPTGLGFVSGTGMGWTCTAVSQTVTCTNAGPLAATATSTITLTVSVAAAAVPSATNGASVATTGDTNAANDIASDPTTVVFGTPAVTSVNPTSGSTNGGNMATISGTNFRAGATVTFGGVAATNVVVVNATTITMTVPAHAAGVVDVKVTNTDTQAATATGAYTYGTTNAAPSGRPGGTTGGTPDTQPSGGRVDSSQPGSNPQPRP